MCGSSSTTKMRSRFPAATGAGAGSARGARAPAASRTVNVGEPMVHFERGLDLVRHQLVAQQRQRRLDDRPDRLQLAFALLTAGERQQVLDDRRRPLGLLADYLQRLGKLGRDVSDFGEE